VVDIKIVLTPREVNQIVAEHLVMEGKMKNLVPIDCKWRVNTEDFQSSECIYEQEDNQYDEETDI